MRARLLVLYFALAMSMTLSVASTLVDPGTLGQAWYAFPSLGLVALCVALRIFWKAPHRTVFISWHERAIDRQMLLFAFAGIISAYQWLFVYSRLSDELDLNSILQAASTSVQLLAIAHLIYSAGRLLARKP
jgi:hypothetical protein